MLTFGPCTRPSVSVTSYNPAEIALLVARAPEPGLELAHAILGPVLALPDPTDRDTLLDTLHLWFECAGSSSAVAARLHYHRNTIHHRLHRIEALTGRSCSDPKAAAELYLALRIVRLLDTTRRPQRRTARDGNLVTGHGGIR
ncbi:PucR family transcriptional regulator [Nocardia sp. NPDC058058]|uniref:PucR family transcriptional regulator n=1 Tax=Nocardia sp. NPDC058058 TaxID=3346317 RepID=UPI0036DF6D4B